METIDITPAQRIEQAAQDLGITMTTKFQPWSLSRNAGEKFPSLNWKVTLNRVGREILTADFMAGSGHCPSHKNPPKFGSGKVDPYNQRIAIKSECETGRPSKVIGEGNVIPKGPPIQPDLADVLHSLASDADVIDYSDFETWAAEFGYDADSRKAEATYRQCLEIALKLRNAIGEAGMVKLREACQDY